LAVVGLVQELSLALGVFPKVSQKLKLVANYFSAKPID
jgi:hypothetical protein